MKLNSFGRQTRLVGPAILVGLIAITGVAQKTSTTQQKNCDWALGLATPTRSATQSGQAHVDLLRIDSRVARSKCESFALTVRSVKNARIDLVGTSRVTPHSFSDSVDAKAVTEFDDSETPQKPAAAADDTAELAKKLSNPIASLISFPLQSNFDFGMGTGAGWRYTLNVQPVIPIKLNDKWNLISRTIVSIIHQGNVVSPGTGQSGLGDTVQSLFFSPNKTEPFIWGAGPVILIPTATNEFLGSKQLGLGATIVALKQEHGWTYGMLWNHIWKVAGGSGRPNVNADFFQPFLSYGTKDAWTYSLNTESTYDWTGNHWAVPIHFQISKIVRFGKQPVSFGGALRCWATSPSGGPEGCGPRIVVTALFPKK
jgi:hypothetical protein